MSSANHLRNKVEQFSLNVAESEAFLFAGFKQSSFSVLPEGTHTVSLRLVPVNPGRCFLPRVVVISKRNDREIFTSESRSVFVLPQ